MNNDGSAIQEKGLHGIQRRWGQRLEEPQAEALRHRRVNSVENSIGAGTFYPSGPAIGVQATAGFSELQAGLALGALEASRKIEIGKYHCRISYMAGTYSTMQALCPLANTDSRFRT
jgi:hypothetical protein